jgi:hypothetical protein
MDLCYLNGTSLIVSSGPQAQRGVLILAFPLLLTAAAKGATISQIAMVTSIAIGYPMVFRSRSGAIMPQKIMVSQALRKKAAPAAGIARKPRQPMTHLLEKVLYRN